MSSLSAQADSRPLAKRLAAFGCTDVIQLDVPLSAPEQLDYLDLLPTRSNQHPGLTAVAEHQGTALLYLVDAASDVKSDAQSLAALRRQLANRSDPAWLGVIRPGSLEIFPIGFHEQADSRPVTTIQEESTTAPLFFQSLVHGTFTENLRLKGTDYVFRKIFELLTQMTDEFVSEGGNSKLDALEVLSMSGRALFFRFLIDRRIVLPKELHGPDGICPTATELKEVFSNAECAAATSAWLDETFNGDFLPLIDESISHDDRAAREAAYLRYFKRAERQVGKRVFTNLCAILMGWKKVGDAFQRELDWDDMDFAHIPIGVLSQVYESFSHKADPRTARDTSVHYTPRTIANLMVNETFAAAKDKASAKVLDSSCGAGIFLVLAFRRLVRERWVLDRDRPKTAVIQDILYKQIRGFDISESALRLASLGLYITAIELNASPRPPKGLKFPRNLRDEVLYRFGKEETRANASSYPLGSLGPEVSPEFDHSFDIVMGNPPWTRLRDRDDDDEEKSAIVKAQIKAEIAALNREFTAIGRRVLTARGLPDLAKAYQNPDNDPDLPFLWRAMEWAKDGGVIALCLPPRVFLRNTIGGNRAWTSILKSLQVTGILNATDLRKSGVWEGMDAAFAVLFARNNVSDPNSRFQFACPVFEPGLNERGRFRIDYETTPSTTIARAIQHDWLLKTMSLGTRRDVELMERLTSNSSGTLDAFWKAWDSKAKKTGEGFNRSEKLRQKFVDHLAGLPVLAPADGKFEIEYSHLKTYGELYGVNSLGQSSAHMPRRPELFEPPLVIVPQSPGENPFTPKAFLATKPVAFSKSFYGYSCAGHPEANTLASMIYLLSHSTLARYFPLMVSVSQGVDYMRFTKHEFDALPFPNLESLPARTKTRICRMAEQFQHDSSKPWDELNSFIYSLYGLDEDAAQVVNDTLFSSAPYREAGAPAREPTKRETRMEFVSALHESLEPFFDVCDEHVAVREADFQLDDWREPWFFLSVSCESQQVTINAKLMQKAVEVANERGSSRIIVHAPGKRGLLLGILNQRRWWTVTRARLCAQHIIREHLSGCGLPEEP